MDKPTGEPTDPRWFRQVLGQYPTGVCVVTATEPDGGRAGFVVGSFTSVSLDPPLVAFFPDKSSTSWPRIHGAGRFCVNILSAEQEDVCRNFATRKQDKFEGVACRDAESGSPIIEGVVAWIDCDLESVTEAGDHYIVLGPRAPAGHREHVAAAALLPGRLRALHPAVARGGRQRADHAAARRRSRARGDGRHRGGHPGYALQRLRAGRRRDRGAGQRRANSTADRRPPSSANGCRSSRRSAGCSPPGWTTPRSRAGSSTCPSEDERAAEREWLAAVRSRGYSAILRTDAWQELESARALLATDPEAVDREDLHGTIRKLDHEFVALSPEVKTDIGVIRVPVFGRDGGVAMQLSVYGLPAVRPARSTATSSASA